MAQYYSTQFTQAYINNPTTKIDFTLPKDANVLIAIFDITGKEVLKVVNENLKAGYYTKDLNLSNLLMTNNHNPI